jgi:transcriptional regulator GlxA family with amidase domain
MTLIIGLYLFDGVEVLDFAGPFEVFTTATRIHKREYPQAPALMRVITIGGDIEPVKARAGLELRPDHAIHDHPSLDCLVVPGGVVASEVAKEDVIRWIAQQAQRVPLVASVCTGAFLLARAGLLDGRRATTHWEDVALLLEMFPRVEVVDGVRWVDEGAVVTSAGISAGIDMSLHLVERLHDRALALRTARQMDFDWTENGI